MIKKTCNKCKEEKNIDCYSIKDTQGHTRGTCKKCIIISKSKFTCPIPNNTRLCKTCNKINSVNDFTIKNKNCSDCRLKPNENERRILFEDGLKKCHQCDEIKSIDDFRKKHSITLGYSEVSYCKTCENKKRNLARIKNGRNITEESKNYKKLKYEVNRQELINNPIEHRIIKDKHRCRKFGITLDDYYEMRHKQNCKCYICGLPEEKNTHNTLVIDHCHASNKIRKLLCSNCNINLGGIKDDLNYLEKLKRYLIEHN